MTRPLAPSAPPLTESRGDLDALPWDGAAPATQNGAGGRKGCWRHRWVSVHVVEGGLWHVEQEHPGGWYPCPLGQVCSRCWTLRDPAASRRGRSSLRAGKDAERAVAKAYGGKRTGQYGGPDDVVVGDLFVIQSKAGRTWFRQAIWDELAKLPRTGGRIPTLVVSDRPGTGGGATRRYVVRMLSDDVALHGEKP